MKKNDRKSTLAGKFIRAVGIMAIPAVVTLLPAFDAAAQTDTNTAGMVTATPATGPTIPGGYTGPDGYPTTETEKPLTRREKRQAKRLERRLSQQARPTRNVTRNVNIQVIRPPVYRPVIIHPYPRYPRPVIIRPYPRYPRPVYCTPRGCY